MGKEIDYTALIELIREKREKLGIKIDPRNFLPVIREEVRYKIGKK